MEILKIHIEKLNVTSSVDIKALAQLSPGFVGVDLSAWVSKAAMLAIQESSRTIHERHFHSVFPSVQPTLLREGFLKVTDVGWEDVGALGHVKEEVRIVLCANWM
jgi:SpoVK/Ycf46/Vps4 family AAA+-type ATPase